MIPIKRTGQVLILLYILLCSSKAGAQNISASQGQGNFIQFSTYQQMMAGDQSIGNIQVGFSPSTTRVSNWKLTVQVSSPISSGNTSLNPQYISLRYNQQLASDQGIAAAVQAPQGPFPLNFTEVVLISNAGYPLLAPPDYYFNLRYDLLIQGGQHIVNLQNGGYIVRLVFRLYDGQGVLRATSSTDYNFNRYFFGDIPNANSIELNARARNVVLDFVTTQHYRNGVSVSLPDGLSVTASSGYEVKVKSTSASFNTTTSSVIPVAAVKLQSTDGSNAAPGTQNFTLTLSDAEQTLIRKNSAVSQAFNYNLRYYTDAGDSRFLNAKPGSYETTLIYTLQPR